MTLPIYIPTRGRVDRQISFQTLPKHLQNKVIFVVCPDEAEAMQHRYPSHRILVVGKTGVPAARQAVLEDEKSDSSAVVFLDDDLRFVCRTEDWTPDTPTLRQCEPIDVLSAFAWMEDRIQSFAMVGLGARGNNDAIPDRWERKATRIMRAFAVDKEVLALEAIRFDKYLFWEDFHVCLSLLTRGYPNLMSAVHLVDGKTNDVGGVALYRNRAALEIERARFLAEWGQWCKANEKRAKSWKNIGDEETMPDLVISWRKAYDYGLGTITQGEQHGITE